MPFLWQHRPGEPIGKVTHIRPSAAGLWIKAQIAKISRPGKLQELTDLAWDAIRSGLVTGLSVGFQGLESEPLSGGRGRKFTKWSILEISAVTIAANEAAAIASVKAA
jgi:HK97 family phage prohead protease